MGRGDRRHSRAAFKSQSNAHDRAIFMTAHISPPISPAIDLTRRAEAAARVAAEAAEDVDRRARFPAEAFAALRSEQLMSIMVPSELGGEDAAVSDVVDICYVLGRACASTAMIFAMHQIMAAILVRHARDSAWHRRLLRRLASEQLLLASSTTDGIGGGDLRASTCAVVADGSRIGLMKNAAVMSYGTEADAIVTTARRSPDAAAGDQVLVALAKDDYRLERNVAWDALGMRGTCSAGFQLVAQGTAAQVLPEPYQAILAQSMMPIAHLTWSGVWSGVAAGAVERARRFLRTAARRSGGQLPPGAAHLTRATATLRTLRGLVASELNRFEAVAGSPDALEALDFQAAMGLLKVSASELAVATVMSALQACGLTGYRNDGEFSLARPLRDILSSTIMINNDRILANAANAAMLAEVPARLRT
jgi:acyl-CoA dehydrogenase